MDLKFNKIAISGKKNSGKNEVALALKSIFNNNFTISNTHLSIMPYFNIQLVAFADPLKKIIKTIRPGIDDKILWSESKYRDQKLFRKPNGDWVTCRDFLKDVSIFIRGYNESILIDVVNHKLIAAHFDCFILTDVRKKDELKWAKDNNFFLIRVIRPNDSEDNDITETDLDDIPNSEFDSVIYNDKTVGDLWDQVQHLANISLIKEN